MDGFGVRLGDNASPAALYGGRQSRQILQRLELRLPRKSEAGARIDGVDWGARNSLNIESRLASGDEFVVEIFPTLTGRIEKIAVDARKPAVQAEIANNPLDAGNGCGMTFGCQAASVCSSPGLKFGESIIEDAGQVSARLLSLAPCHGTVIEHHDRSPLQQKMVSHRQARDACSYDANIGFGIAGKACFGRWVRKFGPTGSVIRAGQLGV
jgi:hypothetical protein